MSFRVKSPTSRAECAATHLARFLQGTREPDLVGTLTTPTRISQEEFEKKVRRWRIESAKFHPPDSCPPRRNRRIEYVLALEYGPQTSRLHGHVLVWKAPRLPIEGLKGIWRRLCSGRLKQTEPLLEPYVPGCFGVEYAVKTFQTESDLIVFSPQLAKATFGLK
jgi:hypothetical protein